MENKARVLIVDDNRHNIKILKSMLQAQGYEIAEAENGHQALESVAQAPPDLILLDVIMPGMDGFATARALRARPDTEAIPILMVTALNDINEKVKGFDAGADDFLSKPFNSVEMLARVKSLLRIKRLHDELLDKNELLERVLMRYVSEDVAREILNNPTQNLQLGGQSCEVSVLFADIRGFTSFSEHRNPAQVIEMLIRIFSQLTPVVFDYHGTLDKYLGDAIMAFYGAPVPDLNSPEQAVQTAWAMQQKFNRLKGLKDIISENLGLGVGICTGEAIVGNVGSERIMDYTVIGNTPNTAKRLQEQALPGQILVDEKTYRAIKDKFETRKTEMLKLKGCTQPVQAYEILSPFESYGTSTPEEPPTTTLDQESASVPVMLRSKSYGKPIQNRSLFAMRT